MEKLTSIIAAITMLFSGHPVASIAATQSTPAEKIVCIDPGHGGDDAGAVNGDLTEAEVNLNIAKRLQSLLQNNQYQVVMTRTDNDTGLTNSQRADICNKNHADILIAIHLNASTDPTMDYTQGLYGTTKKDKALADTLHQALLTDLHMQNPTPIDRAVTDFDDNLLLKANMPATLQETVFITSPTEYTLLQNGGRQQQIAQSLLIGINNWFAKNQ